MPQSQIVVQKYGGTSVGSIEKIKKVAERVYASALAGDQIAVVVSAMSGETNRLVQLILSVNEDTRSRHYDMVVAAGEQVSVALLAAALESLGQPSIGFLAHQLGIRTDDSHGRARITGIDCQKINEAWDMGFVPVIAGFQGLSRSGEITTLGRGGSDTSAVALAAALEADLCEINTDVAGVYTADPRVVPNARALERLDYQTALELASLGSKVLHPRCVEIAAKYQLALRVRQTFDSNIATGTTIMNLTEEQKLEAPVVSGVTLDRDIIKFTVSQLPANKQVFSDIFRILATNDVNIDVITHNLLPDGSDRRLGFTIKELDKAKAIQALESYRLVYPDVAFTILGHLAKVSVVGLGMVSHCGVARQAFEELEKEGIDIVMISTSEIKITCVVPADQSERAVQALHLGFLGA